MEYSSTQQLVINAAKERLKNYSWYKGVCLDNLPTDDMCKKSFKSSVNILVLDTEYWDKE